MARSRAGIRPGGPAAAIAPGSARMTMAPLTDERASPRTANYSLSPAWSRTLREPLSAPRGWVAGASLLSADVLVFLCAETFATLLRAAIWGPMPRSNAVWLAGLLWIYLRFREGLYRPNAIAPPEELRRTINTSVVAGLAHFALLFMAKQTGASRFIAMSLWAVLVLLEWPARDAMRAILVRFHMYGTPVIVLAGGARGLDFVRELVRTPEFGLCPIAVFEDDPLLHGHSIDGVPVLGPNRMALDWPFPRGVPQVLLLGSGPNESDTRELLTALESRFSNVSVVTDAVGLSSLWVSTRSFGTRLMLTVRHARLNAASMRLKRGFDLVVGIPLLLLATPIIVLGAMAVKLVSRGPAFYVQTREGLGGKRIRVLKLRTMIPDADARLQQHLDADSDAREQWQNHMKLRRDPRLLPLIGGFMRRTSLDELPQLWNVLVGDMTLVGPRPFPDYHLRRFSAGFRELRRQLPPGITGFWQVTDRSNADMSAQERSDTYYIHNYSIWLDLWILLRTVPAVLRRNGAF